MKKHSMLPKIDCIVITENTGGIWNGDPDSEFGLMPRLTEDGISFVTQQCQTRGVRTTVERMVEAGALPQDRYRIQIQRGVPMTRTVQEAVVASDPAAQGILDAARKKKLAADTAAEAEEEEKAKNSSNGRRARPAKKERLTSDEHYPESKVHDALCNMYADPRWFGNVNTDTVFNSPSIRGAITIGMAFSVGEVQVVDVTNTRMAPDSEDDGRSRDFAPRHVIPYALYVNRLHFSPFDAARNHMTSEDLKAFFRAYILSFEHAYRSSARGTVALRELIVCRHRDPLGNLSTAKFHDRLSVTRSSEGWPMSYRDFKVKFDDADPPDGVKFLRLSDLEKSLDCLV